MRPAGGIQCRPYIKMCDKNYRSNCLATISYEPQTYRRGRIACDPRAAYNAAPTLKCATKTIVATVLRQSHMSHKLTVGVALHATRTSAARGIA
jgi:hypothetical protein